MSHMLNAPIILLKEGTDTSQGQAQIVSNINACQIITDIVRTTLGPRGMDKLIYTDSGVTITNDGATVMSLLNVVHPAAATLVDIAKSQDDEVGDGTTSVVLLAGELLKEAKAFVQDGMAVQVIIQAFRHAKALALARIEAVQQNLDSITVAAANATNNAAASANAAAANPSPFSGLSRRQILERCASTALNSKLLSHHGDFFAQIAVDAVSMLDPQTLDLEMIGIKKVTGGSYTDSRIIQGVAFKKTFAYAGFEQQPKHFMSPKILLLNMELELKAEKENAEIRLSQPDEYQRIIDTEWQLIYDKLHTIVQSGAKVVLSKLPIGDLATQYFADSQIFCAGRVEMADLLRTSKATGAQIQSTVMGLSPHVLGTCGEFEEQQIGSERFNVFKNCAQTKSSTIILRGGAAQFLDEAERSLHDAIMVVRRAMNAQTIVAGAGSIEMELSRYIRDESREIYGKQQLVVKAFARALECIPRTLAHNSGYQATDILNQLRHRHATTRDICWIGVDCINGGVCNAMSEFIWEPALIKQHAIASATEAACLILSIDETIRQPNPDEKRN